MENNERKNNSLTELMEASMSKIRDMVDSNTIIGEPIQTPDGVTLIPVSRLSSASAAAAAITASRPPSSAAPATAGVKVEPVAFLVVKDGVTRVMPVALPAVGTVDGSSIWCPRSWTGWRASSTRRRRKKKRTE